MSGSPTDLVSPVDINVSAARPSIDSGRSATPSPDHAIVRADDSGRSKQEEFDTTTVSKPRVGDQEHPQIGTDSEKNPLHRCQRPGCCTDFKHNPHVPLKRYCSWGCYEAVRLAKKRLKHWYEVTGCLYAREIYRLLVEKFEDSG